MKGMSLMTAAVALAVASVAISDAAVPRSESCATTLGSEVCTWVVMDGDGVAELGATVPMSLIEGVSTDVEMVWPPRPLAAIALPPEAREAVGIDHMAINWEAHGHPPASFAAPHFDFHFYNVSQAEVGAIDCSDERKPLMLPGDYELADIEIPGMGTLVGLCVPNMGMHAMPAADVNATDAFEATMMMGYYGARPVFFEPMVSRDLLMKRSDFTLPMPSVEGLPAGVRYPSEFRAEYDAEAEAYRLVFTGFDR